MIDVRQELSLARTALSDPEGYDFESDELYRECVETSNVLDNVYAEAAPHPLTLYAIHMIDEVMAALDVENRKVRALRTICALLEEVAGKEPPDDDESDNLIKLVHEAIDDLSVVAGTLERLGHE